MTKAVIENRANDVKVLLVKNPEQANAQDATGFPALVIAASCGQAGVSRVLLDAGAKIDALDREGYTALHRAAKNGYFDCVRLLISRGANFAIKEPSGQLTPESMAASRNHLEIAEFLKGVAAGTISPGGPSGLVLAIGKGDLAQVESLLKATPALAAQPDGAGRTPLHVAMTGKSEIAACLVAQNADVNKSDANNWRPIHIAAEAGRADMVKLLLEHAADPNAAAAQGAQTPLYIAAVYGFTEVVKNLLAAQANPNLNTSQGISPLHRAAENGHIDIVSLLILAKADVNGKDQAGKAALDYAIAANRREVVALLVQHGAQAAGPIPPALLPPASGAGPEGTPVVAGGGEKPDPNQKLDPVQVQAFIEACTKNDDLKVNAMIKANPSIIYATGPTGYNALHHLAHDCNIETFRKILDMGLPVDSRHKYGRTPLHRAAEFGKMGPVRELVERGADVNAVDNDGWSVLHHSAKNVDDPKSVKVMEFLLDQKADPTHKDNDGLTPYGVAKKGGNQMSIQALEARGIKE